jgi:3-phosphoshikimate 1-carboxyvinyltransferase
MIDEIPVLVLAATQADGETIIRDAKELRVKESDRITTTVSEFRKIGAELDELDDGIVIAGQSRLKGGDCESHGDHRMAMSLAIAGLISESGITIHNIECINTSFPEFWEILSSISNS